MTSILAITLSATLSNTPAPPPPPAPALVTQAVRIATGGAALDSRAPARFVPPGGDSLKNGALTGAVLGGAALGGFVFWLCNALDDTGGDQPCAGGSLMAAGVGAAGGALLGAGIDALFDRPRFTPRMARPAIRIPIRF